VGIVGPNGVGKSTFLRIALQQEAPDSGKINHGETVVFGYFGQEGLQYKEDKRSIDYVKGFAEFFPLADGSKVSAGQFMELFGFTGEQQYTPLSKLSGGEKRRLQLMSILFSNPNFLILDEPTNDLDIETLRTLEEFLIDFAGCIMVVSHDRYFMDRMVDHLLVFKGNGEVMDYPGNYSQFRISQKQEERATQSEKQASAKAEDRARSTSNKLSFKEKYEMEQLEKDIPELQKEKIRLETILGSQSSYEEIQKASQQIAEMIRLLDEKEMRWLELSEKTL
jgi:ATP-binding cassette subfamily F protein uup